MGRERFQEMSQSKPSVRCLEQQVDQLVVRIV
ncbi:hypothetical protein PSTA9_01857 [Pseudomonas syringae pv. tomato]|nr:hypothetical protein PSTA9_01857 [Pseudomonas syringae pv. tomato]